MSEIPDNDLPVEKDASSIHVNEYGSTLDQAVFIEEPTRNVLLTNDETLVFEKPLSLDLVPASRPRKVYGGMWGAPELVAIGIGGLIVIGILALYLFAVVPSNRELARKRADSDRLQSELTSAQGKFGNITSTEAQVAKLAASVNDFQLNHLPIATLGKNALYQKINGLIAAYGLVNTTGPDYTSLDGADQRADQQSGDERGRAKFRSLFPGVYVTMTLEGPYQNLRHFINDVERGNDFVVISTIELEPSDSEGHKQAGDQDQQQKLAGLPNSDPTANPGNPRISGQPQIQGVPDAPKGKTHGAIVSLRLELAAYFRRADFKPIETAPPSTNLPGGAQ